MALIIGLIVIFVLYSLFTNNEAGTRSTASTSRSSANHTVEHTKAVSLKNTSNPSRPVIPVQSIYSNCIYCGKPANAVDSHYLTNGTWLHKNCYDYCLANKGVVERDIIGKAHAFWNGYPPDWDRGRKAGVLKEAGHKCGNCGISGVPLYIHHIVSLSSGGSNAFENLVPLCSLCHTKAHGNKDMSQDFDRTPHKIKEMAYTAISKHLDLTISYCDAHGNLSRRRIRPTSVISRHNYYLLQAFCFQAQAQREFRLDRIQTVEYAR